MPQFSRRQLDSDVIDLTDRLAPYADSALRPVERKQQAPPPEPEEPVWTPLDLDFAYRTSERTAD